MRRLGMFCGLSLLFLVACSGGATEPPPPPTPIPPTATLFIVTREPTPGAAASVPTLPVDLTLYTGRWQVDFRYRFLEGDIFDETRFVGSVLIELDDLGQASGHGSLTTSVRDVLCYAGILDDGQIAVTVAGTVRQGESGPELALTITPDDPDRVEHYRLICQDFREPFDFERQTLWPALEVLRVQPYALPLVTGASLVTSHDLAAPTSRLLQGTLETEIRLRR